MMDTLKVEMENVFAIFMKDGFKFITLILHAFSVILIAKLVKEYNQISVSLVSKTKF